MTWQDLFSARRRSRTVSMEAACGMACAMLAAGAGLTYFLDPRSGRRRRRLVEDRVVHAYHKTAHGADATTRDLRNRATGLAARVRSMFRSADAPDDVIRDRIRSRLGRVASHPHAIRVDVLMGCATLRGEVPEDEVSDVVRAVWKTPGVYGVKNQLQARPRWSTPALQGEGRRGESEFDVWQDNWAPGTRFLVGGAGVGMMTYCMAKRDLPAILIGSLGFALTVRAAANLPVRRLVGTAGAGRHAVEIQKTIHLDAPVDVVYGFWSNYDNFPLFMHNVREVRDANNGYSHWTVAGPAGTTVEWDAYLTDLDVNRRIAWESVPGSTVANAGEVRFEPNADGTTRVDVRLSYNPPAGAIGHAVATMFGADPKTEMDQDLMRMKTLIEQARFPHDAAQHVSEAGTTAR